MVCALGLEWALFPQGLDAVGTRKEGGGVLPCLFFANKLMGGEEGVVPGPDQLFSGNVKKHVQQTGGRFSAG